MDPINTFLGNFPYIKTPQGPFQTPLQPQEEQQFSQWLAKNKEGPVQFYDPKNPYSDYDMRGYWKALMANDPRAVGGVANDGMLHFPDTWKTPYHKSFSNESIYANESAPKWKSKGKKNQLVSKDGVVLHEE